MTDLVVTRFVPAAPEQVYRRWLSADELQKWWWVNIPDTTYEVDGREGGEYLINSASAGIGVRGRFTRLVPPTPTEPGLIEMTWIWVDDGVDGPDEHVRVDCASEDGGTLITVTHMVDPAGSVDSYRQGWDHVLDNLTRR